MKAWIAAFQQKPKQVFLVHGEEESKKTFAKLIHDELGYNPVVVMGNSEYELDMNDATIVNMEEAKQQASDDEDVQKVRNKISDIHTEIEDILFNANMAVESSIPQDKLVQINNIVQELEKATISLGTAVNESHSPQPGEKTE